MNLQAYITSGILELYVHGLATPDEVREVELMAMEHPEVQLEIAAIRQAMDAYATLHGVPPPAGLKEKIMQRLEGLPKGRQNDKPAEAVPQPAARPTQQHIERETSVTSIATWILGLALLGALAAVFLFWRQAERASAQAVSAQEATEQLRRDCDAEKARAKEINDQFIALRHWDTKPVQMLGTELGGDAFAVVYWNKTGKFSYLNVVNLPAPPTDKQYQLWAIVDGKPTDMGVFEVAQAEGLQAVEFIENPQAFAVTLEPKGGSESPTLDQMYVMGAVAKG